ncbi:gamma-glutamylcyclotransferase [Pelagovum pacificum]|uniref:glutathione-specific gamma-glutamylcyclotransferase n=1 Tax=Pelagovum pacificum TaxID=2588711 RepID=A0A5C5G8X6_9RHOB|nr:gamma-glutamylcyclotransferase [Pelagovum pacificum]QQA42080.1 gamma-glutamylcyclotransferase [Pelagovum pacificum]TNY31168.1 gamma-glutamylcyclotransferase [Pelagovum pacificum]
MTMWVFGYGSLLWNPGFAPAETVLARLDGYHRSFCMLSIHHRGSEEVPGLVLALDAQEGSTCTGLALRVAPEDEERVLAELRERELISSAYYEARVPLALTDGRDVEALAYIVDTGHRQYVQFDLETQATMIARGQGGRGPNSEYLDNTFEHLEGLGIHDADMDWLVARVRDIKAAGG